MRVLAFRKRLLINKLKGERMSKLDIIEMNRNWLDFLLKWQLEHKDFYFVPRKRNKDRLDKGMYFAVMRTILCLRSGISQTQLTRFIWLTGTAIHLEKYLLPYVVGTTQRNYLILLQLKTWFIKYEKPMSWCQNWCQH